MVDWYLHRTAMFNFNTYWYISISKTWKRTHLAVYWRFFVDVFVCRCFRMSKFRFVHVLVYLRFGLSTLVLSTLRFVNVLTGNHCNSSRWCRWFILLWNLPPNFPQLPFWNYLRCQWYVQRIYWSRLSMRCWNKSITKIHTNTYFSFYILARVTCYKKTYLPLQLET